MQKSNCSKIEGGRLDAFGPGGRSGLKSVLYMSLWQVVLYTVQGGSDAVVVCAACAAANDRAFSHVPAVETPGQWDVVCGIS